MATRSVATVFGGSGFIGRYVVRLLANAGYIVRVAVRDPEGALFLKPMGRVGQIVLLHAPITNEDAVARAVDGAEIVVNLVGILAESDAGDFARMHDDGAGRVARLAAAAGVRSMVHVSAIGADPDSDAIYARTKAAGEQAVRAAFSAATILRPSVVFGPEDQFFNRFATIAAWSPVVPVIQGGTHFQPVYVGDVAAAIMAALQRPDTAGAVYELGGPRVMSFREVLEWILLTIRRPRRLVTVPLCVARLQAFFLERLPGKMLTRDQLRLLTHDNVCGTALPGLPELGIIPTPIDLVVPEYLVRFRPGGAKVMLAPAG